MRCSNPDRGGRFFSPPKRPDQLWGPTRLYSVGTRVLARRYSGWSMKLTSDLHLVSKLRMIGSIPVPPMCLYVYVVFGRHWLQIPVFDVDLRGFTQPPGIFQDRNSNYLTAESYFNPSCRSRHPSVIISFDCSH